MTPVAPVLNASDTATNRKAISDTTQLGFLGTPTPATSTPQPQLLIAQVGEKLEMNYTIARNFGRSLRIPDASLQTSVNFPRTRPLKCMEQTAFLFNLNQERAEMKNSFKITVKHIISYALFMK